MKPRSRPLKRRTSGKKEKKAFRVWHDSLVDALKESQPEDTLSSSNRASSTSSMEQQSALVSRQIPRSHPTTHTLFFFLFVVQRKARTECFDSEIHPQ
jgi:hypothetical protein